MNKSNQMNVSELSDVHKLSVFDTIDQEERILVEEEEEREKENSLEQDYDIEYLKPVTLRSLKIEGMCTPRYVTRRYSGRLCRSNEDTK